jgi:putative exosortase-associated protein (TIGR04073 family)
MKTKSFHGYRKITMAVVTSLLLVLYAMPAIAAEGYVENTGNKFFRGVVNIATGWLEFPRQIYKVSTEDNVFTGFTYGAAKGVADTAIRTSAGVYETGTFFVPLPDDYAPVKNPEYVWSDQE